MDRDERYALEALEALRESARQLAEASWRLRHVEDYERVALVDAVHLILVTAIPGAA